MQKAIFQIRLAKAVNMKRCLSSMSTPPSTKDWFTFPRQCEGNIYVVNWSLVEDGVTPKGNAYQNARLATLTSRLPQKVENGKVTLTSPVYSKAYQVTEAGDSISIDAFGEKLDALGNLLSNSSDLFVEDGGLGALNTSRAGARIISNNAAMSLIFRSLFISTPPRPVDHRARFDGWNLDARWKETMQVWNGKSYDEVSNHTAPVQGQRPIVALVGGQGSEISVQFAEVQKKIVGGTIIAGSEAPIRGLIEAMGLASSVLINERNPDMLAVPCLALAKGGSKDTVLVFGADDQTTEQAAAAGVLYGAYHNIIMPGVGVSALWGGVITPAATATATPTVIVDGKAAMIVNPDNVAPAVTHIVFVDKDNNKLDEAAAVQRLVALSDESKAAVAATIVKGVKISVVKNAKDVLSMI